MSSILGPDQAEGLRKIFNKSTTRIIAVTSGKGGVGKSNFALNLGICIANISEPKKKVVIIDADLGLANIHILLATIPKYNLYHVIKGQKTMSEIIYKTDYGIDLISSASGVTLMANMKEEERNNLIEGLKHITYADFIIIDTSAGISNNVLSFVTAAQETIVITTPEPTAVADAYGIIKAIVTESENANIKLVLNRVKNPSEANAISKKIIEICQQFLNVKIENYGFIYDDPIIPSAVRAQIPFVKLAPNSKASLHIDHIARRILNMEVNQNESAWDRLIKVFLKNS